MRVLILSKACIVAQYQSKLTALAAKPNLDLTVVVPPSWRDERGKIKLERRHPSGYELIVAPIRLNGHFHLHYYPTLERILERVQPDLFHIDEEPYNLSTFLAARAIRRVKPTAHVLFFSWQNILRHYPPPFAWMEKFVYKISEAAIAGNREAEKILRHKGFSKQISVIPQFGVPDSFVPLAARTAHNPVTIGYAGRLVPEKGTHVLLHALAQVRGAWELKILGSGPLYASLEKLARELNLAPRVKFASWISSAEMPAFYQSLDVLVVPSLTRANWKEQFGRVIMEAMACGVPVVGSNSGEIPNVIGSAGIIVPEDAPAALAHALDTLIEDAALRHELGTKGITRVREMFSQQRIVDDIHTLYLQLERQANVPTLL